MRTPRFVQLVLVAAITLLSGGARGPDDLDRFVEDQMAQREIVGLSLAIVKDGRIIDTRAYGTTTRGGKTRVTPATLFQAGSISKPVTAFAAMRLVQDGKIALDEDINTKLKSWKLPDNDFTKTERVTPRRLMSHSAGLTVHGFPGYAVNEPMPSVREVLDGKGNTPAVRVDVVPGAIWRYSGGGYTILQLLMIDVTGRPFPDFMRETVLAPLGMTNSTYEQPLPSALAAKTATGYYADRSEVPGRWHVYPEMAAAGLWTTPTDLARYVIGVQQALAGKSSVITAETAALMLTQQKGGYGLGPAVRGTGRTLQFSHGGRDEGFDALVLGYAETGDGMALMINANDNTRAKNRILEFIAKKYGWADRPVTNLEAVTPVAIAPKVLAAAGGHFEFTNNNIMTFVAGKDGRLYTEMDGMLDEAFVHAGNDRFVSTERPVSFTVVRNEAGESVAIDVRNQTGVRRVHRLAPLFAKDSPKDPDPALTRNVATVMTQMAAGSKVVSESTLLTKGARETPWRPDLAPANAKLTFVHSEDVTGRNITRHGHPVARVVQYRVKTPSGDKLMLVHVDPAGLITDYDMVAR